jgi:hypothetical protein
VIDARTWGATSNPPRRASNLGRRAIIDAGNYARVVIARARACR